MTEQKYDAIVVGSGISGGWAAKELTENGLKVLMLERGENIEHVTGYVNALKAPWELPHRDRITNTIREEHAVMTRDGFMHEANANYWVKDKESPYVEVKPFSWFRGYHVGGRSLMWGRQSYRWNGVLDYHGQPQGGDRRRLASSATRTWPPGMITPRPLLASAGPSRASSSCPTANTSRRWSSTSSRSPSCRAHQGPL